MLFALGMIDRLRELAEARSDEIGLALEEERLPKRIEIRPRRTTQSDAGKQKEWAAKSSSTLISTTRPI